MADVDRISALPDDVLFHIFSFLTTKISVSTGVLSKRWSFLWAHLPNLDFDSRDYDAAIGLPNVINGVIANHKGHNIHTFRLCHRRGYGFTDSELERWTAFAIERNVQKLEIILRHQQLMLPECLFTCKTLVDLRLKFRGGIPMTSDINLPSLKKLHLVLLAYESDEWIARMLSGCPVLQELIIKSASRRNMRVSCCISSPTLKRLVLESEFTCMKDEVFWVKIDTPKLRYLKLLDTVSQNLSADRLTSLNEADICFDNETTGVDIQHFRHVMEFVGKLYNVERLTFTLVSDSVFSNMNITKLHNLRELQLDADWRFITKFLEIADNLRSITINAGVGNLQYWMDPKKVPTCLVSHLGTVRIKYFRCAQQAFDMIRYILRNAKVLKVIEIYFQNYSQNYSKERTKACRIISSFERGSESCQLAFPK